MSGKFSFFEVVIIGASQEMVALEMAGSEGVVLGISEDDSGGYWYGVQIKGLDSVMVAETDLIATGRSVPPESIYDGSQIRVSKEGRLLGPVKQGDSELEA